MFYFPHCSCEAIILFNTILCKSALSAYSFGKVVFCLSLVSVFSVFCFEFDVLSRTYNIVLSLFIYVLGTPWFCPHFTEAHLIKTICINLIL